VLIDTGKIPFELNKKYRINQKSLGIENIQPSFLADQDVSMDNFLLQLRDVAAKELRALELPAGLSDYIVMYDPDAKYKPALPIDFKFKFGGEFLPASSALMIDADQPASGDQVFFDNAFSIERVYVPRSIYSHCKLFLEENYSRINGDRK